MLPQATSRLEMQTEPNATRLFTFGFPKKKGVTRRPLTMSAILLLFPKKKASGEEVAAVVVSH
jgi:hypothetical protein